MAPPGRRPEQGRPRSQPRSPATPATTQPGRLGAGGTPAAKSPRTRTPPGAATLSARAARDARDARAAQAAQAAHAAQSRPGAAAASPRPRPPWLRGAVIATLALVAAALAAALWLRRPPVADAAAPPALRPLSLSELLAGHSSDWRLARLQDNPAVMVIEFPNLAQQGAAMNRMAALLEKADAPRDRVLNDGELAALIERGGDNSQTFYQGHDYDGAGLARFYQLAQRQGVALNADEERVRRELLAAGVLVAGDGNSNGSSHRDGSNSSGGIKAQGVQALITFTATQPDDPKTPTVDETVDERRRDSILRHEASHGRFYTRPVYREHCRRFWREVWTEAQREKMRRFLAGIGYNRNDEDLMLNEAQAFVMNTPDERAVNAAAVGMTDAELATLRTRFWQTLPADPGSAAAAAAPAGQQPAAAQRP